MTSDEKAAARMWADLTTDDFRQIDADRTVAVLPVAAIEQHKPHLPVGVDAAINAGVVKRAIETMQADCPAIFLPMLAVGKSDEHIAYPGTLTLSHETFGRVWYETAASVHRSDLRKILGGQPQLLEIVCRDLRVKLGMLSVTATWSHVTQIDDLFDRNEVRHGIHGGQTETSMMLYLQPDATKMHLADNFERLSVAIEKENEIFGSKAVSFGWQTQFIPAVQALRPPNSTGSSSTGQRRVFSC